jgi:cytochrome c551
MKRFFLLLFAGLMFVFSCQEQKGSAQELPEMDSRTKVRFKQYYLEGRRLYTSHCTNCHQEDGKGLGKLFPPLAQSDYMLADQKHVACLIRNGMEGEITVNGIKYNQAMPSNKQLSDLEIAEIMTYIYNSWGNSTGLIAVKDVNKLLEGCE